MLQQTIVNLIKDDYKITVVGRNEERLSYFNKIQNKFQNQVTLWKLDYSNWEDLKTKIENSNTQFDYCVCWMHNYANDVKRSLFKYLYERNASISIFEILGSSAANPSINLERTFPKTKKVFLGFKLEHQQSRWLTNAEISKGVYDAFLLNENLFTVGVTEPWDKRP